MKYLQLFGLALIASFLIVSCSTDDMLETEIKEETPDYKMDLNVGNRSVSTDAFAAYCDNDGKMDLTVSNNHDLLDIEDIWSANLEDGDFLFTQRNDGTSEYSFGGGYFSSELTGLSDNILSITPDLNYEVGSNDGTTVEGSIDGDIFLIDADGNTAFFPLVVSYTAEIITESTFCD